MECALSVDKIAMYRKWYAEAKPYTEEEAANLPLDCHLDEKYDERRYKAYRALTVLTKYDIPLTEEPDEHQ